MKSKLFGQNSEGELVIHVPLDGPLLAREATFLLQLVLAYAPSVPKSLQGPINAHKHQQLIQHVFNNHRALILSAMAQDAQTNVHLKPSSKPRSVWGAPKPSMFDDRAKMLRQRRLALQQKEDDARKKKDRPSHLISLGLAEDVDVFGLFSSKSPRM